MGDIEVSLRKISLFSSPRNRMRAPNTFNSPLKQGNLYEILT